MMTRADIYKPTMVTMKDIFQAHFIEAIKNERRIQ